ncbi:MAG: hypothetical protein ACD_73C00361G0001 [uncultured bacterium]|nr:MAG: hypothetical protein ACD_73C00361G0001 [uncultured bacterium]
MKKSIFTYILAILLSGFFIAPAHAETLLIKIALNWFPEVEHGGYYAAKVNHLYDHIEQEVKLIPGGPDVPLIAQLASGQVPFAVLNADDVLLARAQGIPLVALVGSIQTSPLCLMVREDSAIKTYDDLKNTKLALSPKGPFTLFLKKKQALDGVTIIPYSGNLAPFLVNPNMVSQAYLFSEPVIAKEKGVNTRCLMASETGFNPYTSILVTTEKVIQEMPDVVEQIAKATAIGWRMYWENPLKANDLILGVNRNMDRKILAEGALKLKPLIQGDLKSPDLIGSMSMERWKTLYDQLKEVGLIKKDFDLNNVFNLKFIKL